MSSNKPSIQQANLRHEALLLLSVPSPAAYSSLKSAYAPAIASVLSSLFRAVRGTSRSVVLDIAIATRSGLRAPESQPRSRYFAQVQKLLAAFYRLLGVVSVAEGVELDGPGGVDARVFFVDCDSANGADLQFFGPIIGFSELAASKRSWGTVYSIANEQGDVLLQTFVQAQGQRPQSDYAGNFQKLPGEAIPQSSGRSIAGPTPQTRPHYSVAVGGTFDHLHAGHKLLLAATVLAIDPPSAQYPAQNRRMVTVGITGDELLVNKKYAEFLESWEQRWQGVWEFLRSILDFTPPDQREVKVERASNPGPNGKYVIVSVEPGLDFRFVQISDPFGPTITDPDISTLVVSGETRSGGKAVNDEREKKGWSLLEVFEVDVLELGDEAEGGKGTPTENFEAKISSTEIRKRRMNLAKGSSL